MKEKIVITLVLCLKSVGAKMEINEYQTEARKTAVYPDIGNNFIYPTLGLCGEAGEVAEKVKKILRDENGNLTLQNIEKLTKEMGDVLWYLANLSTEINVSLEEVAQKNLDKLQSRKDRNKIHGDGDER